MYDIAAQISPAYPLKGTDPHLWTSPLIMMATAVAVEQNLARMEPENADVYSKNLEGLLENITRLDDQIRKLVEKRISRILLVYHPAWGHFCHDFELQQLAIEDEGKAPGAGSLSALFAMLEKKNIDFIISAPFLLRLRADSGAAGRFPALVYGWCGAVEEKRTFDKNQKFGTGKWITRDLQGPRPMCWMRNWLKSSIFR